MAHQAVEIEFERGEQGYGFNIRGGIDIPHLPEDNGIFVAKIREDGTAAVDGRLKEGDKILEINGRSLDGVTHKEAVAYFRTFDKICLKVLPGEEKRIIDKRASLTETEANENEGVPEYFTQGLIVLGVAASIGIAFLTYRLLKSKS